MEIDLREIFFELKKRIWLILAVAVIGAAAAGVYSKALLTPQYTSTSMMYVLSKETTLTTLADLQIGTQLTQDYKIMITSRPVMEGVIEKLGLPMSYKSLRNRLSISNPTDTRILYISVSDADPQMAKAIVDEVAEQASEYIAEIMEMTPPKIAEDGEIPTVKASPNIKKNVMLGGIAGAFLVCAVIVLMVVLNDTIQSEEDVEKYLGLSVLAVVPDRNGSSSQRGKSKKRSKSRSSGGGSSVAQAGEKAKEDKEGDR
ncbi:MAG: Wzz/FepE/Etk N-terminal domain-containing protein [bacterium]|nr:Wzz/FepE/Etk N-terminal domain-containing protein [bacterium]